MLPRGGSRPMRGWSIPVLLTTALVAAGCVVPGAIDELAAPGGAAGFTGTHVFPGAYETKGNFARVLVEGALLPLPQEIEILRSAYDGASMEIGVVRPDVPEGTQVPVIVFASPYLAPLATLDFSKRLPRLVENFVPHGYAVAFVPVRGTADHGACMDLMGPAERADLDQAITWLGEQPWSNGRIGMVGVSYDGSTPWEVAATGNPYLKTIVPISGVNDLYHLMFKNGTNEFRGPLVLNALYYQYGFLENNPTNGRSAEHTVTGVLCPESLEGLYASAHSGLTGERDPLGFWAERNSRPGVEENYQGSIFLVQGLQDWNVDPSHSYPWVNALEDRGIVVKHLLGQWAHAWPDSNAENSPHARWDWAEILLRWFDRELKGLDVDVGPKVQVEDSSGRWRSDDSWPPRDATPVTFYLAPGGALATEPASGSERVPIGPTPTKHFPFSFDAPELDAACVACAVFASEAFEREFRFAGLPLLPVTVVPSAPFGHVAAWLYEDSGSTRDLVGWAQLDIRFAEGGEVAKPAVPGQPLVARMQFEPLDVVIPAGSRLVLVLHQGSYGDHVASIPTAPMLVEVGGEASSLTVSAFERDESAFFVPPGKE